LSAALAEAVEHLHRQALGVGRGLEHDGRHGGHQHGLGHAAGRLAMPGHIAGHLAAAGAVADVHGVAQVQVLGHREGVGRVVVHVMAFADLGRAAVAAAVVRHHAEAALDEEQHLRVPVVAAQRPAVVEDDGLGVLGAPVLVEDLGAVGGGDEVHGGSGVRMGGMGGRRRAGRAGRQGPGRGQAGGQRELATAQQGLSALRVAGVGCGGWVMAVA
jgi:hypothetical protein